MSVGVGGGGGVEVYRCGELRGRYGGAGAAQLHSAAQVKVTDLNWGHLVEAEGRTAVVMIFSHSQVLLKPLTAGKSHSLCQCIHRGCSPALGLCGQSLQTHKARDHRQDKAIIRPSSWGPVRQAPTLCVQEVERLRDVPDNLAGLQLVKVLPVLDVCEDGACVGRQEKYVSMKRSGQSCTKGEKVLMEGQFFFVCLFFYLRAAFQRPSKSRSCLQRTGSTPKCSCSEHSGQ